MVESYWQKETGEAGSIYMNCHASFLHTEDLLLCSLS